MRSASTPSLLQGFACALAVQLSNVYAHAVSGRDGNCPSRIERDVIVVGGGSGGT
jgi:hypothetical protein